MNEETKYGVLIVMAMILILVGCWVGASHFEAQSYNKLTGNDVTTWDAMWVQLRVQDAPQLK